MRTSKSPRRVLQVAYEAAGRTLPAYRHKFSPKKFTQPQLMACLVLKEFLGTDYRGLAAHLADHADLCRQVGLKAVPHFTTFQKAAQRLLAAVPGRRMFDAVLERALRDRVRKRRVRLAAIDGTGMESRHVSRYFTAWFKNGHSRVTVELSGGRCVHRPRTRVSQALGVASDRAWIMRGGRTACTPASPASAGASRRSAAPPVSGPAAPVAHSAPAHGGSDRTGATPDSRRRDGDAG